MHGVYKWDNEKHGEYFVFEGTLEECIAYCEASKEAEDLEIYNDEVDD